MLAPKVTGAALLDAATTGFDLDHFVLFSSASAVLGPPGQASYAAANADSTRSPTPAAPQAGLRSRVDWGAWAEVGMASRLAERERRRLTERGVGALPTAVALDTLGRLLDLDAGQAGVLAIDWPTMIAAAGVDGLPPLLDEVAALPSRTGDARRAETATGASLLAALREVADDDHAAVVRDHVVEHLVRVLGLPTADAVDDEQDLAELGMDSLMAVELTNRLRSSTGLLLSATLAIERPSVRRDRRPPARAARRTRRRRARSAPRATAPVSRTWCPCRETARSRSRRPSNGCCSSTSSRPAWPSTTCRWCCVCVAGSTSPRSRPP